MTIKDQRGIRSWDMRAMCSVGHWHRDLRRRSGPPNRVFGPAMSSILGLSTWAAVLIWTNALLFLAWDKLTTSADLGDDAS